MMLGMTAPSACRVDIGDIAVLRLGNTATGLRVEQHAEPVKRPLDTVLTVPARCG